MMRWQNITFLYGACGVVVILAVLWAIDFTRRRRFVERREPKWAEISQVVSARKRWFKACLHVMGLTLICLALARPQIEGKSEWQERGIDVVLVVDFSPSMLAEDVYPNRLQRAQVEVENILADLAGDRVGVVAFAGNVVSYPLTTDHEALRTLLNGLLPQDLVPGSHLGEALRVAYCHLEPGNTACGAGPLLTTGEGQAIVIFSDGEDTAGNGGASVTNTGGVVMFWVGVGTLEGALVPGTDHRSRLQETKLLELARLSGNVERYHRLDSRQLGVEPVRQGLKKLRAGRFGEQVVKQYREAYHWFLFPAFCILLFEACLSERKSRSL